MAVLATNFVRYIIHTKQIDDCGFQQGSLVITQAKPKYFNFWFASFAPKLVYLFNFIGIIFLFQMAKSSVADTLDRKSTRLNSSH